MNHDTFNPMTVQELIDDLLLVKNKQQVVGACIHGIDIGETAIHSVYSEKPDKHDSPDSIGVCWLRITPDSCLHEG